MSSLVSVGPYRYNGNIRLAFPNSYRLPLSIITPTLTIEYIRNEFVKIPE